MLERTDHVRKLDRLRKKAEARRKLAGKNQLRHYRYWMPDVEATEIVADARRIDFPSKAVIEDLQRIDSLGIFISDKEYREIVARLLRVNYKHFKAALEK